MGRLAMCGLVAVVLASGAAVAQGTSSTVKDDLFAGTERFAKGASDVTEVTMDPGTLDMVGGNGARRAHNMVLNVVRTYEYDKPGMYNIADVEEFRHKLDTGDWHCSVHTRDLKRGESTDICAKQRTDGLLEQAIITVEPKELTFIHTIKRPSAGEHGGPGDSMLFAPEIPGLSGWDPAMQAKFAAMGPVMEAKFAAMGPVMEAKMAAMGPRMEAQMAEAQARMAAHRPGPPKVPAPPKPPAVPKPPAAAVPAPPAVPVAPVAPQR